MAEGPVIDIVCFSHRTSDGKAGVSYRRYVVPAEKAGGRLRDLLIRLVEGEIDSFSVSLRR